MAYLSKNKQDGKKDKFKPKVSWMQNCEWDSESKTMTITFDNGSQYAYQDVSMPTWQSFKESPDHGTYYSRAIKGRIASVPITKQPVGQKKSSPLKKVTQRKTLVKPGLIPDILKPR